MTRAMVVSRGRTIVVAMAVALTAALLTGVAWQVANPNGGAKLARAAVGVRIEMTVVSVKQGTFKGEDTPTTRGGAGFITVTGYDFEASATTSSSSGLPTGKAAYKPVVVTHVMGGSSPQFLGALATNETLKSVVINFFHTDRSGKEINYYRVTLTNANVVGVKQYTAASDVLEDDSLSFRKMEQQDFIAKTTVILETGIS